MRTTKIVRISLPLLMGHVLATGCLLTTNSDDDDGSADSDTDPSAGTDNEASATLDSSDGSVDDTGTDDSVGETTGTPTGECSETRIVDGGFEAGSPSDVWTEASENFGTPICDIGCTEDEGAVPYAGTWFAWFGGLADPEVASVEQSVTIDGETAFLSFRFEINAAAGTGDDTFDVTIDGTSVFMVTDADIDAYDQYTPISIDVSEFVDGGTHVVRFESTFPGTGLTNFFLDEVALVTCVDGGGSSSTGGSDSSSTAADSASSDGSSDSSSSGGSSSDAGSSDSGSSSSSG